MYKYLFILISLLSFSAQVNAQLVRDFKVNDDTAGSVFRYYANISTNKTGLSAIVWEEYVLGNIYAQVYDNNFVKINNNFKVNVGIDTSISPDIAVTNREKIGVVWSKPGALLGRLYFKIFNKYGSPLTPAIQLVDTSNGYFGYPRIGCDSSGRFIIGWSNSSGDVYFQILDSMGNKIGNNVKVSEENYGSGQPDITVRKDGSFVIVWTDDRYSDYNIYMQMFNKNGYPIGINQRVNDTIVALLHYCHTPKIAHDSSGNFVIAFDTYIYNDNMTYVYYQRFTKDGIKIGNNKEVIASFTYPLASFDSDEIGNLIFQLNLGYASNIRVSRFDIYIGPLFPISNEYLDSAKNAQDIKLYNGKIINVWMDSRSTPQPQIYANVRSFLNPDSTVGVINISNEIPEKFKLYQNYPNPFNPTTFIKFQIKERSFVTLKIFDLLGREMETLVNEIKPAGTYEAAFDASHLPSGVYFYNFFIDGIMLDSKKMILLK